MLSRGLALLLVVFGGLFAALGPWLSPPRGPIFSSLEHVRRFEAALRHDQQPLAALLGLKSIEAARADGRWSSREIAELEYRVAEAAQAAGQRARALELARTAHLRLGAVSSAEPELAIDVARTHADLALAQGQTFEAACAYGLLLERLGADRIAHPEHRLRPHPAHERLTAHLDAMGERFANAPIAPQTANGTWPPTSCNLLATFYVERSNIAAASAVSETVLAETKGNAGLDVEIRGALLQQAGRIAEAGGDVATAKARLTEAIQLLDGEDHKAALAVALESLATLLTNWSDPKAARPVLARAIALREETFGARHSSLVFPMLALGYAQLDTGDPQTAEATLKQALDIARSEHAQNPGVALEAMLALRELYEDQGRTKEASDLRAKTAELRRSGAALRPTDVEDVPIEVPSSASRLAIFEIPFLRIERGESAFGRIEVGLTAASSARWIKLWNKQAFVAASESFKDPLVYVPTIDRADTVDDDADATLIFIPGEGTALAANAARLARLHALAGPGETPLLVDWQDAAASPTGLRNASAEIAATYSLRTLIVAAARQSAPLTLIAEGRGATLFAKALEHVSDSERRAFTHGLTRLVFVAPDMAQIDFAALLGHFDRSRVHIVVYAARTARPLLIAREMYGAEPIGLDPARLSAIAGIETIEIGIGSDWSDFESLTTDALIADIANVVRGGPPAAKRCGLAVMTDQGDGEVFVLNPKGCAPKIN